MANVNNIIVGAANVWVSKKDSTEVAAWPTYALPTFTANLPLTFAPGAAESCERLKGCKPPTL